jgi:hypothetical protein
MIPLTTASRLIRGQRSKDSQEWDTGCDSFLFSGLLSNKTFLVTKKYQDKNMSSSRCGNLSTKRHRRSDLYKLTRKSAANEILAKPGKARSDS